MTWEAITLDTTLSGASTNAYLTLAECNALIHARPFHDDWDDITDDDQKKAAIVWATRKLSEYKWQGYLVDTSQALPFPRRSLYDYDQRELTYTDYPEFIKVACAELAFTMATEDRLADSGTEGFSDIKVGPIAVKIDKYDRAADVPDAIYSMFKQWVSQGAAYNTTVLRA